VTAKKAAKSTVRKGVRITSAGPKFVTTKKSKGVLGKLITALGR
jgi:hypothetical protein